MKRHMTPHVTHSSSTSANPHAIASPHACRLATQFLARTALLHLQHPAPGAVTPQCSVFNIVSLARQVLQTAPMTKQLMTMALAFAIAACGNKPADKEARCTNVCAKIRDEDLAKCSDDACKQSVRETFDACKGLCST